MKILYIIWIFLISGCYSERMERSIASSSVAMRNIMQNDGPPELKQGIYDGCMTAIWTRGNSYVRYNLKPRLNPDMILNDVYYFAFSRSYRFCFITANMDYASQIGAKILTPADGAFVPKTDMAGSKVWFFNNVPFGGAGWFKTDNAGDMWTFGAPEGFEANKSNAQYLFNMKNPGNLN